MAQLTVDLSADKATLARIAQLILQFAGYEPPTVAATLAPQAQVTHPLLTPAPSPAEPERLGTFDDPMGQAGLEVNPLTGSINGQMQDYTKLDATQVFVAPVFDIPTLSTAAAVIPPPPPPAGIDVDLRGLPWDPRIHASTRAKTAEGNWRQKRNVDPELMTKVEAELRQTMGAPVPLTPLAAGVGGNLTVPVPLPPIGVPPVPFVGSAVPPAPPTSSTPPVPASAGAATGASPGNQGQPVTTVSFPQLMQAITKAFTGGALNQQQITAAVQKVGLASLPMLASRPDLVGAVSSELGLAL